MIEARRRIPSIVDWEMLGLWVTVCALSLTLIWLGGAALYWAWVIYV